MSTRVEICQIPSREQFKYFFKNVLPEYKRTLLSRQTDRQYSRDMTRAIRAMTRESGPDVVGRIATMENKF